MRGRDYDLHRNGIEKGKRRKRAREKSKRAAREKLEEALSEAQKKINELEMRLG